MRVTYMFTSFSAICLTLTMGPLGAAVLFSDINNSVAGSKLALGSNVPVTGPQSVAVAFTLAANSTVNEIQLKAQGSPAAPTFNLFLYSDNGGAPGASLASLGTDLMAPAFPAPFGVVPITSFAPLMLTGGKPYWLVMTPFEQNSQVGWGTGGIPATATDVSPTATGAAPWAPAGSGTANSVQVEIDGTAAGTGIPEPGTIGLVVAALGLGAVKRKVARGTAARTMALRSH